VGYKDKMNNFKETLNKFNNFAYSMPQASVPYISLSSPSSHNPYNLPQLHKFYNSINNGNNFENTQIKPSSPTRNVCCFDKATNFLVAKEATFFKESLKNLFKEFEIFKCQNEFGTSIKNKFLFNNFENTQIKPSSPTRDVCCFNKATEKLVASECSSFKGFEIFKCQNEFGIS
jgi:hypothetical protein